METNRLKQFCVVFETGNLRKAADILHMSHSALSKSLKVLQDEIGLKLLEQDGRGIVVTDAGREFVQKAQALLDFEKQILAKKPEGHSGFKVASFESFSTHLLGMKWHQYFGDLPLQIHELSTGRLEQAVVEQIVDAAITYEPIPTRELEFQALGKVRMGIYHRRGTFKGKSFADVPFVAPLIPSVGTPSSARGLDGWPEHEHPRSVKFRVDLLESGLALVRSGRCAIFIPEFVARAQNEALSDEYRLVERPYPAAVKPVERRIFLVVRRSRQKEKLIRRLTEMVKRECVL